MSVASSTANARRRVTRLAATRFLTVGSIWTSIWLCLLHLSFPTTSLAQAERSELGKRLKRFEQAWQVAPVPQRVAATPSMEKAVQDFFSLRFQNAARNLDQAWFAARHSEQPNDWEQTVAAFRVELLPVMSDAAEPAPHLRLLAFYNASVAIPEGSRVELSIDNAENQRVWSNQPPWESATDEPGYPLPRLPAGDYRLQATVTLNGQSFEFPPTLFSKIDDLANRIQQLEQTYRERTGFTNDSIRATVGEQLAILNSLKEGQIPETDLPTHRILSDLEWLTMSPEDSADRVRSLSEDHDVWLSLAKGRNQVPTRIRSPRGVAGSLPVLFLFHGAGGSENMFFETYGAGRAVQLALDRGWLVVAPRQGLLGLRLDSSEMLDALSDFYPVDRQRVFFLGHSMGAAQAIRQANLHPEIPRAVAAIGGGGRITQVNALRRIPWFVAAGERDFGKRGAEALADSLKEANAEGLVFRVYADVEHMVIVQAALDDLFDFFDQHSRTPLQSPNANSK